MSLIVAAFRPTRRGDGDTRRHGKDHVFIGAEPRNTGEEMMPVNDKDTAAEFNGYRIVVLDRGFVYVGFVERRLDENMLIITEARNIRRWGTDEGLGQLALKGPQGDTVLDKCGIVIAPWHALQHVMITDPAQWGVK